MISITTGPVAFVAPSGTAVHELSVQGLDALEHQRKQLCHIPLGKQEAALRLPAVCCYVC